MAEPTAASPRKLSRVKRPLLLACASLWLGAAVDASQADGLRAGLWKIVTHPEMNGVPASDEESTRCLTDEEVNNLEATFSPNSRTVNSNCDDSEHEASPRSLTWRLRCTGQINMDVAGEFVFDTPEHYTATITTRASMAGRQIQSSRALTEGTHIGACR
jgi:hypothetical protein